MAAAGALFTYLADEVGEQAWLTRLDAMVARFFHRHGVSWLVNAFEAVTFFGTASTLTVLIFYIFVIMLRTLDPGALGLGLRQAPLGSVARVAQSVRLAEKAVRSG